MLQDIERLQLAALLHDIGKFRQRTIATPPFGPHERHGAEFVTEDFGGFFHPCGDDLGDAILNHHRHSQTKEIEKQVTLADRLSAKEREVEQREQEKPSGAALVSIMSRLQIPNKPPPTELRYNLNPLDIRRETIFPTENVEQIQAEQTLEFSIKIDKSLFRQREKSELGYSERQERVLCEELAGACNWVAEGLANDESNFFHAYHLDEIDNFYDALLKRIKNLPDGAFVLPIGWGTGYRAKTVTELLTEGDNDLMMNLREHYQLGGSRSRRDYYHSEFPKTRRVLYDGERPKSPLGWVQIAPKA